jgi:hypothetical protein
MHCFLAQDWVTVRGAQSGVTSITQGEHGWLDLSDYEDTVAWLDVKEFSAPGGTLSMAYQTAPLKDSSLFVAISGPLVTVPFAVASGVTVTPLLKDSLGTLTPPGVVSPLARWFRWQLTVSGTLTGAWDVTFRLFVAANCLGAGQAAPPPETLAQMIPSLPSSRMGTTFGGGR